jgi:hypothetical protein
LLVDLCLEPEGLCGLSLAKIQMPRIDWLCECCYAVRVQRFELNGVSVGFCRALAPLLVRDLLLHSKAFVVCGEMVIEHTRIVWV